MSLWSKILFLPLVPALGIVIFIVTIAGACLWYQTRPPLTVTTEEVAPASTLEAAGEQPEPAS